MIQWISDNTNILLLIMGLIFFSLFVFVAIIFFKENEPQAAKKTLIIAFIVCIMYGFFSYYDFDYKGLFSYILIILPFVLALALLLPINGVSKIKFYPPIHQVDERDTMFSRKTLVKGDDRFTDYYKRNPQNLELDKKFRAEAGLLSEKSINYDPVMFAAANASFYTVGKLKEAVDGTIENKKVNIPSNQLSHFIKQWAKKLGALDVGMTYLKDYHKYSFIGRGEDYGKEVSLNHKYAIAFTVEMDVKTTASGPQAPVVMESAQQYLSSGAIAVQLAALIRNLGYAARAHIDANYRIVCPLVARDAGLGEIGRMGLLMTPKQGPRVRIAVVTTDIPLIIDEPKRDYSMIHFCELCKKCAHVCPSNSISEKSRENIDGVIRWKINSDTCFHFWCKSGTDCGRCMASCPYAHPNNFLHNFIRFGIKNNFMFRYLALKLDDYFYGKLPKVKSITEWMKLDIEK